jgi:hydrogenase nickel incorporation protein HypA/HybF
MHEVSLIQALFAEVDRNLAAHPHAVVHAVHVRIGELAGVEPTLFRGAYDLCRGAGNLATAELIVTSEPARWTCPLCNLDFTPGTPLTCAHCGTAARLAAGGDIFLDRIEAEVSDV